ncbi:aldo/keto reductase [Pseudomonas sp. NA-150]|uniref:aldo/keto reductase n=1 Tax=Pseudomonas sp. NA-150 TaxID=3367525 RepID=UPI0037C6CD38
MSTAHATSPATFKIGGEFEINRLGFGAMRITGRGIWGPPADHDEVIRTLRRLPELGVNFIDTADSYGPNVSEELICEALHPYGAKLLVATKAGLTRSGPDQWAPRGDREYLLKQALDSCKRLGVEQIDLWQLHRIDPKVSRDEQFATVKYLIDQGIVRHVGLSEVSVDDVKAASQVFTVSTVQNRFNLIDRGSEAVLDHCTEQGIGFIPWFPLAAGDLTQPGGLVDTIAKAHNATAGQIALAWLLQRSPIILPIPGTSKVKHLEENIAALEIQLTDAEMKALNAA